MRKIRNLLSLLFIVIIITGCQNKNVVKNTAGLIEPEITTPKIVEKPIEKESIKVNYTDEGYDPVVLDILIGDRVLFTNNSSIPLRVASDPHPEHSDYDEFDAEDTVGSGGTFLFEFDRAGTYSYHNHMKSLHKGVVRIVDPDRPEINIDKTLPQAIKTRDQLLEMFDPEDSDSIRTLFNFIRANNRLVNDCHDIAHDLGHRAYELYGFSRALTYDDPDRAPINDVDDICAGGYMHGVLEELFLYNPEIAAKPDKACAGVSPEHKGSCFHGVGHGVMFSQDRNLAKSVAVCASLEGMVPQHRCYEGVYMEFFWGETFHADGNLGWELKDPLLPCAEAGPEEAAACYLYAHLGYLRSHTLDYPGSIKLCTQSPSITEYGKKYCIKGVGITMMKSYSSAGLERTEYLTKYLSTYEEKYAYYNGVLGYAILSGVGKSELERVCNALVNDGEVCFAVLNNI